MSTITLYKDKVNGVGSLLDDIIKSSNNLSVQLGTLKNTLQGVDSSTCNLQDTVDSISSSSKSEDEKVEDLKTLNSKLTEFIEMTANRDSSAKDEINKAKEVLVFKGGKVIVVSRATALSKGFQVRFRKAYIK